LIYVPFIEEYMKISKVEAILVLTCHTDDLDYFFDDHNGLFIDHKL